MSDIATEPETAADVAAAPGATIGRFVLEEQLGAGGMGVVFAARDPVLDRRVAIKLLRPGAGGSEGETRLLREAQALARLTDPNVVTVHEAGVAGGSVYLVMELVDGTTLREWAQAKRPWREIAAAYLAAGRGLAAAHAAGMVHRDFKPGNVFVDKAGRVKVGDFGLVGAERATEDAVPPAALSQTITNTGSVMGTPAYMAPEQRDGEEVDARADQYAFCIALREALAGASDTGGAVPGVLRPAIDRGLEPKRERRFPKMTALLYELDRGMGRRKRVLAGASLALLAVSGTVGATLLSRAGRDTPEPCADADAAVAALWPDADREATRATFATIDSVQGAQRFAALGAVVDPYVKDLRAMHVEVCRANRVTRADSDTLHDRRVACLARRRAELATVIQVSAGVTDKAGVDRSVAAATTLAPVAACANSEALLAALPPPDDPVARKEADAIAAELDAIRALRLGGKLEKLADRSEAALARARKLGHPPTMVAALRAHIQVRAESTARLGNEPLLKELVEAAAAAHADADAAWAWSELMYVTAEDVMKPADALVMMPAARAALARAGDDPGARVDLIYREALVLGRNNRSDDGKARLAEAMAILEKAGARKPGSPLAPRLAHIVMQTGNLHHEAGEYDKADPLYRETIAILKQAYGPDHPDIATPWQNLGDNLRWQGKTEDSLAAYRESIRIWDARIGETAKLAANLVSFAASLVDANQLDEAQRTIERAIAILTREEGGVGLATAWMTQGLVYSAREDMASTNEAYDKAIALFEAAGGNDINLGITLYNRGEQSQRHGDCAEAIGFYERALAQFTKLKGDKHPHLAYPLGAMGRCLVLVDRPTDALERLDRSLALGGASAPKELTVQSTFFRARALYDSGKDRAGGLKLARATRPDIVALGPDAKSLLDEADAWLKGK